MRLLFDGFMLAVAVLVDVYIIFTAESITVTSGLVCFGQGLLIGWFAVNLEESWKRRK